MPGTRLALTTAFEIAAGGDGEAHHDHGQDGGQSCGESCPVEINQGKAIVGLIQRDVCGRVGDLGLQTDLCVILGKDVGGLGSSGGDPPVLEVLLDEHLFPILVDDALSVSNEERHDVEVCGDGRCDEAEVEAEGKTGDEFVDDEGGRCGTEVEEGENCT